MEHGLISLDLVWKILHVDNHVVPTKIVLTLLIVHTIVAHIFGEDLAEIMDNLLPLPIKIKKTHRFALVLLLLRMVSTLIIPDTFQMLVEFQRTLLNFTLLQVPNSLLPPLFGNLPPWCHQKWFFLRPVDLRLQRLKLLVQILYRRFVVAACSTPQCIGSHLRSILSHMLVLV